MKEIQARAHTMGTRPQAVNWDTLLCQRLPGLAVLVLDADKLQASLFTCCRSVTGRGSRTVTPRSPLPVLRGSRLLGAHHGVTYNQIGT